MAGHKHSSSEEARTRRWSVRALRCPFCGANPWAKCIGVRGQRRAASHTERWQASDPTAIGAKAQRKEAKVPQARDDAEGATCSRCKEDCLHWVDTAEGPRLFAFNERGRPVRHFCKPQADEFEDLTGAQPC